MNNSITKAVILCGGFGTRMFPASKVIAKEMFPLIDKPVMQFLVEDLIECGITEILFVSSKEKTSIINYFQNGKCMFYYVFPNQPKGVADALLHSKSFVGNERFVLLFGDVIFFNKKSSVKKLIDNFNEHNTSAVAVFQVPKNEVSKYGCVEICKENNCCWVKNIVEKPDTKKALSNVVLAGQYLLSNKIFNYLENIKEGQLFTDCLVQLTKVEQISVVKMQSKYFDIGSKKGFVGAINFLAQSHPEIKFD